MFSKYYQDELQFLRELGEEFAKAHPAAAHELAGPGRDPDVERLLEGFAFLSARVREKLDDEFPELTHGLIQLLWPHYLRPIPSMAILEFSPLMQALRQSQVVPRGAEVQSVPVEGTPCRFRTTQEVVLNPIALERVSLEARAAGPSSLRLGFRIHNQAKPEALNLSRIRLHLHGDPALTYALYHHLCRHVEGVRLTSGAAGAGASSAPRTIGGGGGSDGAATWRPLTLEPAGFADDEALLPYPTGSFPGYRLLQEYFTLPSKFLFVDVVGAGVLPQLDPSDRFEVEVRFDRQLAPSIRPTTDDIRLYCTPIVNLFSHETDPVRIDRLQSEYRLRPSGRDPFHYEIYTVDRVTALATGAGDDREVPSFYSFDHLDGERPQASYTSRLHGSVVDDRLDVSIAFVDARGETTLPEAETVVCAITATNRRLAEALRPGDVNVPTDHSPAFVQFKNLGAPTPSVAPPLEGDLPWRLISHLSLNYLPLVNVDALRGVLQLYNFAAARDPRAARANALRLEGIHAIASRPSERLVNGCLLRGTAITLEALEDHFAGDGDLFLFATLLNEFMSLNATLNSFTQFSVRGAQKGDVTTWPARIGRDRL